MASLTLKNNIIMRQILLSEVLNSGDFPGTKNNSDHKKLLKKLNTCSKNHTLVSSVLILEKFKLELKPQDPTISLRSAVDSKYSSRFLIIKD